MSFDLKYILRVCSSEQITDIYKKVSGPVVRMLISLTYNSETLGIT